MPPNGNRTLHDDEYRSAVNGVVHWCRVAAARHRRVPLVIVHGGHGGNNDAFERTIGPRLEQVTTVI
jgi:proline iminopeptidase